MRFPFFKQYDSADCGPTCLRMISKYYGKDFSLEFLRKKCFITREGVSLLAISDAAEDIGFKTLKLEMSPLSLFENAHLPCIVHWRKEHFIVLYKIVKNSKGDVVKVKIADPASGLISISNKTFLSNWIFNDQKNTGIALFLEPGDNFLNIAHDTDSKKTRDKITVKFIVGYFLHYKKYFLQLVIGMVTASLLSLIFPFLTQSIIDIGVENRDLNFIFLILLFQLFLFIGTTTIELIQNQMMLHISTRINLTIISDFLTKLMHLPIKFYDSKNIGDITNRINDQKRIEVFITSAVLRTLFSILNFIIYTIIIATYSIPILLIFLIGSLITFGWTMLFMARRRALDYKLFNSLATNNENIFELINGMQEIKLNQFEFYKKSQWQNQQVQLLNINISTLKLEQYQAIGSIFFTQLKNILITFFASTAVINGEITLGIMLSISFIIGQLNSPIEQFISIFKLYQNAKISVERMTEVYHEEDEEQSSNITSLNKSYNNSYSTNSIFTEQGAITFKNICFSYEGPRAPLVLDNISFQLPLGRVTAIVGASGSGKTTLIKLLLKFYRPNQGEISINGINLSQISAKWWRKKCGSVMQDGYLFSDTIERNIVTGNEIDLTWLNKVCEIACIDKFITDLPLGLQTKIGKSGMGISGGEKQRILICRAIYKNPDFLFLDEAISALDSNNEKRITHNLNNIYKDKTVVIIAHRLSTVKNADQIIVMNEGKVVEIGAHRELVKNKGWYFNLVKNQLELEK